MTEEYHSDKYDVEPRIVIGLDGTPQVFDICPTSAKKIRKDYIQFVQQLENAGPIGKVLDGMLKYSISCEDGVIDNSLNDFLKGK